MMYEPAPDIQYPRHTVDSSEWQYECLTWSGCDDDGHKIDCIPFTVCTWVSIEDESGTNNHLILDHDDTEWHFIEATETGEIFDVYLNGEKI